MRVWPQVKRKFSWSHIVSSKRCSTETTYLSAGNLEWVEVAQTMFCCTFVLMG